MRDVDGRHLWTDDPGATKNSGHGGPGEEARRRLAQATGYMGPEETTPTRARHVTPSRHNTNLHSNRIASIKRGGKARSASPLTGPSTTFTPPNTFTTTPSTFSFGADNNQQQSQGFGASGGGSFTFGQQQPSAGNSMDRIEQTSAPAPAASFTFGQQPSTNGFGQQSSNPFSGFGQQTQQNGQSTPSFGGFGQSDNTNNGNPPSSSFTFGQQTQNTNNSSTTFGGFGAQSNSASPAPTNPFAGFSAPPQQNGTETSNPFAFGSQQANSQSGANGSTTPSFGGFGASQPSAPPSAGNLFAPAADAEKKSQSPFSGSTSLFNKPAETPKADGWSSFKSASPALAAGDSQASGASVLSGWQKEQTSKPAFSFSQSQMTTSDDDDDAMTSPQKATPAQPAQTGFGGTSSLFGATQPAATPSNDLFSRISKPNESTSSRSEQATGNAATPKAPAPAGGDLFGRMTFPDKSSQPAVSATPAPKPSNPFAGFSAAPPATAPAKNLFANAGSTSAVPATPTPAADKEPEAPATVKPAPSFSANSLFSSNTPKPSSASSLFAPKSAEENSSDAPAAAKPAPSFKNSLFSSNTPKQPAASSPFSPPAQQTTPAVSQTPAAPAAAPVSTPSSSLNTFDAAGASKMSQLNEGLRQRLEKADPNADYTSIMKFYIKKAKQINDVEGNSSQKSTSRRAAEAPAKSLFERTQASNKPTSSSNLFAKNTAADATPKPATTRKPGETNGVDLTKSLFGQRESDAQTPKPALSNGLFGRVPATEPNHGAKKRSIETDESFAPGTEKHRKSKETVEYPKLPAGASNTAKLFEAALDKPADSGAAAKSLNASKTAETPKASEETPKSSIFGGFKPSTSSLFTPKPAGETSTFPPGQGGIQTVSKTGSSQGNLFPGSKPAATGGFQPTFAAPAAGGSNFLSAFGQNASKAQDDARQKAMDEDFDSEDDDPEEWKKQYEEKQAAKRKAIEDAAKSGGGFSFKATATDSGKKEEKKDEASKDSATGDNTWKQGTPIKFGAEASTPVAPTTAPPKASGLFGSTTTGSSLFANAGSKTPQPSTGSSLFSQTTQTQTNGGSSLFSFSKTTESSTAPSATPKPAETAESNTNGDATEGDEDAANDPQVEDMTALQASEKEESDILYHVEKAKSYKFEQKPNADKPEWTYKALGPIWLLKNKSSGKTRMLQKVAPLGKAGMNFNVLTVASMYSQAGKRVMASFVDHINEKEATKPSQWFVQFGKEDDAKEVARLLKEQAEKQ